MTAILNLQGQTLGAETIASNIHFEPEQDERQIVQTLARAGIYAATSQYEPFGLAPVEAALSRCAIIASDIPTFRELWDGAAVFFRNNDAVSLCRAVESLQRDPALRRAQGNLAYLHARQSFSAERMVAGYRNLYQSPAACQGDQRMRQKLNIALFSHSMVSDWNHGNAHFLRGLMRELVRMGHTVRCYEELSSWSLTNMMKSEGERAIEAIDAFRRTYPELDIRFYKSGRQRISAIP